VREQRGNPAKPAPSWRADLVAIASKVDRLFRLDHAARVEQIEAAFEKLLDSISAPDTS